MEISKLTIKLIIILIPGVIASRVYSRLTKTKGDNSPLSVLINTVLLGMISYLILQMAGYCIYFLYAKISGAAFEGYDLEMFHTLDNARIIPYSEVFYASVVGLFLAILMATMEHQRWIMHMGQWLGISTRLKEEHLFAFFLKAGQQGPVRVIDTDNNLSYEGTLTAYNDSPDMNEIVMENVSVYRYDNRSKMYDIKKIYLSQSKQNLIVESTTENG